MFVQKFQNIAKHQIPQLFAKCAKQTGTEIPTTGPAEQVGPLELRVTHPWPGNC